MAILVQQDNNLNIYDKLSNPVEEAYKVLRSNIQFYEYDKAYKTMAIISQNQGAGKTTICFNLAISFAKAGQKTLLLDADLRKPKDIKRLGSEYEGLSNCISGNKSLDEFTLKTSIENLSYIPSGVKPPNPTDLLGSNKFAMLLKELKYDKVIIDTPSMSNVIDGAIIASLCDSTIIVSEYKKLNIKKEKRLINQLNKANANIIGSILNKVSKGDYRKNYTYYCDVWDEIAISEK